ncbi:MAG TPA: glycosyltransferase family protein [bacterium]|nr:glycosyltransferase family protein [bacterium]
MKRHFKKIAYSVSGDGGGHVSRNQFIINHLSRSHQVDIYSFGNTLTVYQKLYETNPRITCQEIPGIVANFNNNSFSILDSVKANAKNLLSVPFIFRRMARHICEQHYDLSISDCEFYFSYAARLASKRCDLRCIHINHHPVFSASDLSFPSLPFGMRSIYRIMSKHYMPDANEIWINSFYRPQTFYQKNMHYIGPVLRQTILTTVPSDLGHVLVYLKHSIADKLYPLLTTVSDSNFIVYAAEPEQYQQHSHIILKKNDPGSEFVADLASSSAVIGVAGIDLPSEAIYLGKPVLGIAEHNQFEQYINGHQLMLTGGGMWTTSRKLNAELIRQFLTDRDKLAQGMLDFRKERFTTGNTEVIKRLEAYIS